MWPSSANTQSSPIMLDEIGEYRAKVLGSVFLTLLYCLRRISGGCRSGGSGGCVKCLIA